MNRSHLILLTLLSPSFAEQSNVLTTFDGNFDVAYMSFKGAVNVEAGIAHIKSKDGRGGALVNTKLDLSAFADHTPALRLRTGAGKEKYLAGAIAAAQYSAGANPMNMTMTKGVGHDYPRHVLHIDANHTGTEAPDGITVYGPSDPALKGGPYDWAHTWYLGKTMVPSSRTWPAAEFYVDLSNWPPMTEYTVHQTFGPTSFYWGFLGARK